MNLFYKFAQLVSYSYFRTFHGFEVSGLENVPRKGAFILASNHLSFFDPPALGCRMPRNLHYFARNTLFFWPLGTLIRNLNSIPVNRDQLDLKTLKEVLRVLGNGDPLLVFPEGTRSGDGKLGRGQKGIGLLVSKAGVPVLPARIWGTEKVLARGKLLPRIGQKMSIRFGRIYEHSEMDPGPKDRERYQKIADRVLSKISSIPNP